MRFKVGDKVRIKDECVGNNYYDHLWFNEEMEKFKDRKLTIQEISGNHYWIVENIYFYNDAMLEPFEFKVGDEVVFIKDTLNYYGNVGRITYVKKMAKNKFNIIIELVELGNNIILNHKTLDELLYTIELLKDFNEQKPNLEEPKLEVQDLSDYKLTYEGNITIDASKISINTSNLGLPNIIGGENKMDILEIYKERKIEEITNKYAKIEREVIENDEVHKIIEETENRLNVLLDRDEDNEVKLYFDEYEHKTLIKLKELALNEANERNDLDTLIDEIKAQLEISDSYVTTIEIYKNYGILDKEGKIYNGEKSKK